MSFSSCLVSLSSTSSLSLSLFGQFQSQSVLWSILVTSELINTLNIMENEIVILMK